MSEPRWDRNGLAVVDGCMCSRWGPPPDEMRRRKYRAQVEGVEAWLSTWGPTASAADIARVIGQAKHAQAMLRELEMSDD